MAEWILTSSLLIGIVLAVRALFRGRMGFLTSTLHSLHEHFSPMKPSFSSL